MAGFTNCGCGNAARYIVVDVVTPDGKYVNAETCALCAAGKLAVRKIDVPQMLELIEEMIDEIEADAAEHSSQASEAQRDRCTLIRGMIGRRK